MSKSQMGLVCLAMAFSVCHSAVSFGQSAGRDLNEAPRRAANNADILNGQDGFNVATQRSLTDVSLSAADARFYDSAGNLNLLLLNTNDAAFGTDLNQLRFQFDQLVDPNRLTQLRGLSALDLFALSRTDFSQAARIRDRIIQNHLIALHQVELAIRVLKANRNAITSGMDDQFNRHFGLTGIERDVAVLSNTPISGVADATIGNPVMITFDDDPNGRPPAAHVQLRPGDVVYIGGDLGASPPVAPQFDLDGFTVQIVSITADTDGSNQMAVATLIDPPKPPRDTISSVSGKQVSKVLSLQRQADTSGYESALSTFESIRDGLRGFDPNLQGQLQVSRQDIFYGLDFVDFSSIWTPGDGVFSPLQDTVDRAVERNMRQNFGNPAGSPYAPGAVLADRRLRQAGLSNSDSDRHLDRLEDQRHGTATDRFGDPTLPLLWVDDDDLPLWFNRLANLESTSGQAGASNFSRAFYWDQLTIFGEPDNVHRQHLGPAFLERLLLHDGDFLNDPNQGTPDIGSENDTLELLLQDFRAERSATAFDTNQNNRIDTINTQGLVGLVNILTSLDVDPDDLPETSTPRSTAIELQQWQMVIESFAEWSTTSIDVATGQLANDRAFVGLNEVFGGFTSLPDSFRPRDAESYARFADAISGSNSLAGFNFSRVEPFGKRATAGFSPVVPRR
jgi:hypothetical protein